MIWPQDLKEMEFILLLKQYKLKMTKLRRNRGGATFNTWGITGVQLHFKQVLATWLKKKKKQKAEKELLTPIPESFISILAK